MQEIIKPRKKYTEAEDLLKREGGATAVPSNAVCVILRRKGQLVTAFFQKGQLEQIHVYGDERNKEQPQLGEVYLGKVTRVAENLGAAFVDVQKGISCYLSLGNDLGVSLLEKEMLYRTNRTGNVPIKAGDELLVQVTREALKTKLPAVNGKITNCENIEMLRQKADHALCYTKLVQVMPGWLYFLQECLKEEESFQVITDDAEIQAQLKNYRERSMNFDGIQLRYYEDARVSLTSLYSIETHLSQLTARQVWLKCGGYLVIDHTEAMTVIDVNSGKCIRKDSPEELIQLVNKEAGEEVFRQLRLRNLSGMILVDFVNIKDKEQREQFFQELRTMAQQDPVPTKVHDITALGIVEITRKKVSHPLAEQLQGNKKVNQN